jgi:gliding motility-associated-like protein
MRRSSTWHWLPLFLLPASLVFSQTITYQNPTQFFVCNEAPFSVTVTNSTAMALQNVSVTVNFTTSSGAVCGVRYVQGSVTGANESNVSNLSAPVFQLSNLPAGAAITFTLDAEAPCQTVGCIDGGEFFVNQISLTSSGGSSSVTTNPYVVERALLVFTAVNNYVMTGAIGNVLQRKITIRNTRPGALESFIFTDTHQGGIAISSSLGTVVPAGPNVFQLQFDGSDFATIGDGDGLFELNETLVITEQILIIDCGLTQTSSVSNLSARWGCDNEVCQEAKVNAIVAIKPSPKEAILNWEPVTAIPECFCGPDGYRQGMKITNTGDGAATAVQLFINNEVFGNTDPESITVDSAGVAIDFLKNTPPGFGLPEPCTGSDKVVPFFDILLDRLEAGASVTVFWDVYFCGNNCQQPQIRWRYRYGFCQECSLNPCFLLDNESSIPVLENGKRLLSTVEYLPQATLEEGMDYQFHYSLNYDSLTLLNDTLQIDFRLQCGIILDPGNDFSLGGEAPLNLSFQHDSVYLNVSATYLLPLPANNATMSLGFTFNCDSICVEGAVCKDTLISSCPVLDSCISPGFIQYLGAGIITTLKKCPDFPKGCNVQTCQTIFLPYDCPVDSTCLLEPAGYVTYDFEMTRWNLGLADNNNDRQPDPGGAIDLSLIRPDRFMTGDTIHASFRGAVTVDRPEVPIPFARISLNFFPSSLNTFNMDKLASVEGLPEVDRLIRIFDKSQNAWYECADLTPTFDSIGTTVTYFYDLNPQILAGCGAPSNFTFQQGDSVLFDGWYQIRHNIVRELDNNPLMGALFANPSILIYDDPALPPGQQIDCACDSSLIYVSGYEITLLPGIYGLPPCTESQYSGGGFFSFALETDNWFPFEYRNLLTMPQWSIGIPPYISFLEGKLTFLRYQGGVQIANQVPLTPAFSNDAWHFDLNALQNPPIDEGFSSLMQYRFDPECDIEGSHQMTVTALLDFAPHLPEDEDPLEFTIEAQALRAQIPNLLIQSFTPTLISYSNQISFDFFFQNFPTVVASQTSGPALNTWLWVESHSGLVTDFQLINLQTGLPYPAVNGVFQLGNFPVDTVEMRLLALNNSCETENLTIHYGWNCIPFNSPVQTPCYDQTYHLTVQSPPGEIDFFVTSPTGCSDLCDTIPYHTVEIFNAQLGAVYNLTLDASLPPGFSVMPGSSQVEYPAGSGSWVTVGNPTVNGTNAIWNLTQLPNVLQDSLPGLFAALRNALRLRFLGETTCDLLANTFLLFTIAAEQNCGVASNTVAKPGDPICINGVTAIFSTNVVVTPQPGFGCNDEVRYDVSMTSSATLPAGACVFITLPNGISFQPGSCSSVCQANFNCTPTVQGNLLTWQLPSGIPPNQVVCFSFNTTGWEALGCTEGVVLARAAYETQAFCATAGANCSVKVATGAQIMPFNIQRPAFELDDFLINALQSGTNDLVSYSIKVTNNGTVSQPPLILDFFIDTDGNGTGDVLIVSENYPATLLPNETETFTGQFTVPGGNLCNLVAVINPDAQCACEGDSEPANSPIPYVTEQDWMTCSGFPITIGIPATPGFTYQWTPADCLSQPNQSTTVFSCGNDTGAPIEYLFELAATNGSCEIDHQIAVNLQPQASIVFAESPICLGESANMAASQGVAYQWSGPGITEPTLPVQTVTPTATSTYSVIVQDEAGCSGSDTVVIVVNQPPVAEAGADTSVCPGSTVRLNPLIINGLNYVWMPAQVNGQPVLSNPNIPDPVVLTNQQTTFTLTVTDPNGCSATDDVTVSFGDTLDLSVTPPQATICLGSSLTLTASGADDYQWSPTVDCLNPECSVVVVTPSTSTTYTVSATDATGCTGNALVTVEVTTDAINTTGDPVTICMGQSALLFNVPRTEAGVYCDTITLAAGCDSIHCIELIVNTPPDSTLVQDTICQGETVNFLGTDYTEAGTYCESIPLPNGCDSLVCLLLTVSDTPQVNVLTEFDTIDVGDSIVFTVSPAVFDSILWFNGDELLNACTNETACRLDSLTENTTLTAVVVNGDGCTSSAQKTVAVLFQCNPEKADIPNVFTPNGDQTNDVFTIVSPDNEEVLLMKIWNRWGQLVYEGTGPWDGKQDGEDAESDVYIYYILIGCPAGVEAEERVLKGDITLLR